MIDGKFPEKTQFIPLNLKDASKGLPKFTLDLNTGDKLNFFISNPDLLEGEDTLIGNLSELLRESHNYVLNILPEATTILTHNELKVSLSSDGPHRREGIVMHVNKNRLTAIDTSEDKDDAKKLELSLMVHEAMHAISLESEVLPMFTELYFLKENGMTGRISEIKSLYENGKYASSYTAALLRISTELNIDSVESLLSQISEISSNEMLTTLRSLALQEI